MSTYQGGKASLAKHIIPLFGDNIDTYVEPFVGGCNVIAGVKARVRIGNDVFSDLIECYQAIQQGWVPEPVSRMVYNYLKKGGGSARMRGYAAHTLSFSGSRWGGYISRDHIAAGRSRPRVYGFTEGLIRTLGQCNDVIFTSMSYDQLNIPDGAVVYCDPPYAGTKGYKVDFDHEAFWRWAAELSARCRVFVSEFTAPGGWGPVWSHQRANYMSKKKGDVNTEHVFTYNGPS